MITEHETDLYEELDRGYDTPCWIWQMVTPRNGYGLIVRDRRQHIAHRWMYERHRGPIPVDLELHHLCYQRACVNPEHLVPVTHQENCRLAGLEGIRSQVEAYADQYRGMAALWKRGWSATEIAAELGIENSKTVYTGLEQLRALGWDIPTHDRGRPRNAR